MFSILINVEESTAGKEKCSYNGERPLVDLTLIVILSSNVFLQLLTLELESVLALFDSIQLSINLSHLSIELFTV